MAMNITRTTLRKALRRWGRGIARACRWRRDGAVIPGRKRGLSAVIPHRATMRRSGLLFAMLLLGVASHAQAQTTIYLTTGTTWVVPADWNNANNTIEVIGGGGGGKTAAPAQSGSGGGGGGGAYSKATNVTLTPGLTVTIAVGAAGAANGGAGGDTYLCNALNSGANCANITQGAVVVGAKGGAGGAVKIGGAGGATASGVGATKFAGGTGAGGGNEFGGGGGGGAGGTTAAGSAGVISVFGANGGAGGVGGTASGGAGGTGGLKSSGPGNAGAGGAGGTGTVWDATHGAGGGGGGGGYNGGSGTLGGALPGPGGAGGKYGGGGGGGGDSDSGTPPPAGAAGSQGIITVFYAPSFNQSAYRLFNNADSTDVGTPLAALNTAGALTSAGAAFRLRMLVHVGPGNLAISGQAFKLQYVDPGTGTCAAPSGTGTPAAYTDVTAATLIAYNNNPTPADGANLTANASDPTHAADTVKPQTYEEVNNFTNTTSTISAAQDGKWDFALKDNGAPSSTIYCLRAVKSSGALLEGYTVYPQISTVLPGSFDAFETNTAPSSAIAGKIYTKLAGTPFSLDVVAILSGVKLATFTKTAQVDLVTGSTGGSNCPGTPVTIAGTTQSVSLTSGRGTTGSFNVATAYPNVRVRVQYPVASPTVTSCSTDNFSIRPTAFSSVTSNITNSGTSGVPVAKAGDAFTITAVAGAGYNVTPSIDNTKITAHAGAVQNGSVAGSFGAANPASGTATGAAFTYSEVGNFTIGVNGVYDGTFTAVDAPGTECTNDFSNLPVGPAGGVLYGCSFGNSVASNAIGRFSPDHFIVTSPTLTNRQALGCAPASTYTYEGEQLRVTFTLTAQNGLGTPATTKNYTTASGFAKLDGTVYTNFGFGAVGLADATPPVGAAALTARVPPGTSSGTWVGGIGNFTVDLAVNRAASPDGPFESFQLGVRPQDPDGVTLRPADLNLDIDVPANGNDLFLL